MVPGGCITWSVVFQTLQTRWKSRKVCSSKKNTILSLPQDLMFFLSFQKRYAKNEAYDIEKRTYTHKYIYLEAHLAFYFDPFDFGLLFQSFQKKKVTGIRKRSFTVLIQMINTQWLPTNDVLAPYGLDRLLPLLHLWCATLSFNWNLQTTAAMSTAVKVTNFCQEAKHGKGRTIK